MKRYNYYFIIFFLFFYYGAVAQQGGQRAYSFLQIPNNAIGAALGGNHISGGNSIQQIADNPALLDSAQQNISFNYANYVADINGGSVFFHPHQKLKNYAFSIQYFNYGNFIETDENGLVTGEFSAGDYALSAYRVFEIMPNLTVGLSSSVLFSSYPQSVSLGGAISSGLYYKIPEKDLSLGFVVKNFGTQFITHQNNREKLPFEIQMAATKRLAKAPFRIMLMAHNLQTWDLTYEDQSSIEIDPFTGEEIKQWFTFDKLMRHFTTGLEFFPSNNFLLRFSYNHQRRQNMMLNTRSGFAGFGIGTGIKFNKFTIDYGLTGYHLGGALHMFTLNTKI